MDPEPDHSFNAPDSRKDPPHNACGGYRKHSDKELIRRLTEYKLYADRAIAQRESALTEVERIKKELKHRGIIVE
jgi:hypothetical protein